MWFLFTVSLPSNSAGTVSCPRLHPIWRMGVHWKDWCWSWNSSTLATSCEELTHWKRPWCWEGLGAGGEGDDRGWDGWMASLTWWTWVWVDSGSWRWTGRPGVLRFIGSQRVGHDWATELNWTELKCLAPCKDSVNACWINEWIVPCTLCDQICTPNTSWKKKLIRPSLERMHNHSLISPVSREDRFLSVKLLLFRLQSIRKSLRRLVFSALSPHTDVLQFLTSKNSPTSENPFIPFQLNKCRIFIGFHYFLSTCDIYINYESIC